MCAEGLGTVSTSVSGTTVLLLLDAGVDSLVVLMVSSTWDDLGGQGRGGREGLSGLPAARKHNSYLY